MNLELDAPKPLEPLTEDIHPDNRATLEAEIKRRHDLLRAKLTWRQRLRLQARYNKLHQKLNRAGYNRLVKRRAELHQTYLMILAAYKRKPTRDLQRRGRNIVRQGQAVTKRLADLAPIAAEFADVADRLRAHNRVLALEREERENRAAFYAEASVFEEQIRAVFKQSPRLHYVYKDREGAERIRIPEIQRVIIKPDKLYYQIRTVRQGLVDRWLKVWHSALPYSVDVKGLTCDETLENLTAACGRIVTVERSKRSQNLFYVLSRLDSADGLPNRIYFDQVIDYYPADRHQFAPWCAGVGEDRKAVFFDFDQFPNVLVAGAAGGGKSNLINEMLATWTTMASPEEVRIFLIDNKGGIELTVWNEVPHRLADTVSRLDDVLPALRTIRAMMEARYAAWLKVGARKLEQYNAKVKDKLPRVIVVIDELATLLGLGDMTKDLHTELRVLSSQGRAAGIHLVLCTQHPSVDVLPGWIKTNLTLRISGKMPNHVSSQIVVDSDSAARLPDVPGRMVIRRGGFEMVLQTPLIEESGINRAIRLAQQFDAPGEMITLKDALASGPGPDDTEPVTIVPRERFGKDDYLAVAIERMEGKISPDKMAGLIGGLDAPSVWELRKIKNALVDEIKANDGRVVFKGDTYQLKKDRNSWALVKTQDSTQTESRPALDTSAGLSYQIDEQQEESTVETA